MFYRIFALDVRRSLLGRWKRFSVALLFFCSGSICMQNQLCKRIPAKPRAYSFCDAYLGGLFVVCLWGLRG